MSNSQGITHSSIPKTLQQHLQILPQELFDICCKKTFTPITNIEFINDGKYHPPFLMQVDRHSRALFATEYFSKTTFVLPSEEAATRWLISLDPKHRAMVQDIKCVLYAEVRPESGSVRNYEHCIDRFNAKLRFECLFGSDVAERVEFVYREDLVEWV